MSDDLVKRLRQALPCGDMRCPEMSRAGGCTCGEAADRIEQLEAALREIAQHDIQAVAIDALHPNARVRSAPDAK